MRKILLCIAGSIWLVAAVGQKTELALSLNSGLFSFSGRSATSSSFINYNGAENPGYTNNPYGSRPGWSYGLSAEVKHVVLRHFLIGIDGGYEVLRSRVRLTWVSGHFADDNDSIPIHGQTILTSRFINFFPYLGFRLTPGKFSVDVTGGFDVAHCLHAEEKGQAKDENNVVYNASLDRKTITTDVRPRVQLTLGYHKMALYIGYSKGISNYMAGYVGGPTGAYARILRFGIQYRLI